MTTWAMSVVAAAASVFGAGLTLGSVAHAEPPSNAGLVWQAPATCPDAGEVRLRIERRLGTSIDRMVRSVRVDVEAHHDGAERRFVARIDLRGVTAHDEVRVVTGARCEELTDAVAVIVARIASEAARPRVEVGVGHPEDARAGRSPPGSGPWGAGGRLVAVSGIGALPGVGAGGELSGYVRARSVVVEIAAARWLPHSQLWQIATPGRVDVNLDLLALRVGWGPVHLPLRAWLVGELGAIDGRGASIDEPRMGHTRWIGAGTGFAVAWPMTSHTRLVGMLELVVPVQVGSEVLRPSLVTVRSGLGLEVGWR